MERFRKFRESGDGRYLRKKSKKGNVIEDSQAALAISEDFYNHFGMSSESEVLRQLKKRLAELQLKRIVLKDRRVENEVNVILKEILKYEKNIEKNGATIMETKSIIDKHFGFVKLTDITVLDFFSKIKMLEKQTENGRAD